VNFSCTLAGKLIINAELYLKQIINLVVESDCSSLKNDLLAFSVAFCDVFVMKRSWIPRPRFTSCLQVSIYVQADCAVHICIQHLQNEGC
jgi:hypothetical protein